ncbi:MAG: hypothetical protein ACQUHE_02340 [Bacteroidia bacterium]
MSNVPTLIVTEAAKYYTGRLVAKIVFRLKRVSQELRLNPDNGLNNTWEEICVQLQTEKWNSYNFVEDYLIATIDELVDELPVHIQYILSYDEFANEELTINKDFIIEKIIDELYAHAREYSNTRIEKFIYGE